jgi:hypothetical protein
LNPIAIETWEVEVLAATKSAGDASTAAHQLCGQRVHAPTMRKIMAMATVVGKDDVRPSENTNDAHGIGFLADTGVGRAEQTAPAELLERLFLEQANAKHLVHQSGRCRIAHIPRKETITLTGER